MKKLTAILTLFAMFSLLGCSSSTPLKLMNKSPRGVSVMNNAYGERAKAYRAAEKYCAKYYKVPRILRTKRQTGETGKRMSTIFFECLKPN